MEEKLFRFNEVNLYNVLKDLLYNIWVVILLVISVWLGVDAYEKVSFEPQYTSEATFVIRAKGNSSAYSSLNLTNNMSGVISELFKSNILRERVEQKTGESMDGYVSTRTVPNTNLMIVSMVASSPEKAFVGLNNVINTYPEISDLMLANAVMDVIKDPQIPMSPSNYFNASKYKKTGLVVAFAGSIGLICLLSVLRDTVQTPAAAKRKVDGRLLGSVRHEQKNKTINAKKKKKNIAPLITNPVVGRGFKEDHRNLCTQLEYHMRKRNEKIVLVSSAGENEGKSTVAANLALGLARLDKKVALLDCDFRKPAVHKIFQAPGDDTHDLGNYLCHDGISDDLLIHLPKQRLWVAVNRTNYKYPQRLFTSGKLKAFIQKLSQEFDYIVMDTPPMTVAADTEALASNANVAVLVAREDGMGVRDINDCMDSLYRMAPDVAGFVLNNCHTLKTPFF